MDDLTTRYRHDLQNGIQEEPWYQELGKRVLLPVLTVLSPQPGKWAFAAGAGAVSWALDVIGRTLAPNWMIVVTIGGLIFIDLWTALSSVDQDEGQDWSPEWKRQTAWKFIDYYGMYYAGVMVDNAMLGGAEVISYLAAGLIVYQEVKSIEKNVTGEVGALSRKIRQLFLTHPTPDD